MHRLPGRSSLAAFLLLALIAAPTFGQVWKGRGRLGGEVTDEAGQPVVGATVTLRMQENPTAGPKPIETDKYGKWSVLGLVLAVWTVNIEAPGFDPSQGVVKVNEYGVNPVVKISLHKATPVSDPRFAKAQEALDRASALLQEKKPAEARIEFESALPVLDGVNRLLVLKRIAFCQMLEENDSGAVETLKIALAEAPDDAEALRLIVDRLVVLHREAEAQEYIARMSAGSLDPNTLLNLGIQSYNENKLEAALANFEQVVTAKPDWADGYYYRGLVSLAQGKTAAAKADFAKVLALEPEHRFAGECRDMLKAL